MKEYKNFMGEKVYLGDPEILEKYDSTLFSVWKHPSEMTRRELIDEAEKLLGYALLYMQYYNSDVDWGEQEKQVNLMCEELSNNLYIKDIQYWKGFVYRIADKIENLC